MSQQPATSGSIGSSSKQPSYTTPVSLPKENFSNLGYFLDGWADLIEGMGDYAEEVSLRVFIGLRDRKIRSIFPQEVNGIATKTGREKRRYILTTTHPGATTAIYVGKHGIDLYASWRTFIRPVINQNFVFFMLVICVLLGLITGGFRESSPFWGNLETTFSLIGWILATIGFAILAVAGIGFVGRLLKGNFFAFFFIEPNIFDAEDITAMSLSAHKSLLRALDNSGIDVTKLRLKREFKGGRRGEDV